MIALWRLLRIRRHLEQASADFNVNYPTELQDWEGDAPDLETIRNLQTAMAQIDGWIMYRRAHRRDQYVRSPIGASPAIGSSSRLAELNLLHSRVKELEEGLAETLNHILQLYVSISRGDFEAGARFAANVPCVRKARSLLPIEGTK